MKKLNTNTSDDFNSMTRKRCLMGPASTSHKLFKSSPDFFIEHSNKLRSKFLRINWELDYRISLTILTPQVSNKWRS